MVRPTIPFGGSSSTEESLRDWLYMREYILLIKNAKISHTHPHTYTHTHKHTHPHPPTHPPTHTHTHTNREQVQLNVSALSQQLHSLDVTPAVESAIAERIASDGTIIGLNFSVILMDFEPYADCQTSIERQCTISATSSVCETPTLRYISVSTELFDVLTH